MKNWNDDLDYSARLANEMAVEVKKALSNPDLTEARARTLLNQINQFYFDAQHILQSIEDEGYDVSSVDHAEHVVEAWASMSATLTTRWNQLRDH